MKNVIPVLTKCELEILQYYCDGWNCKEIEKLYCKSRNTVRNQCTSIKQKLNCNTMPRAVALGLYYKLIEVRYVE